MREELKTAQIVINRFHVAEHYHAAADDIRKEELKRLKYERARGVIVGQTVAATPTGYEALDEQRRKLGIDAEACLKTEPNAPRVV